MSDFRFANLLGAPYRGGTLLLHDNWLFSPVGNRVTRVRAWPVRAQPPDTAAAPPSHPASASCD